MSKKTLIVALVLYLVIAGASFAVFSFVFKTKTAVIQPPSPKVTTNGTQFDQTLPKTEACPLNGVLYSTQQRNWWEQHRPLAVMIENHVDARPQSGISKADVVYEAIAEGGITRTMDVFYCQDASEIAPIRSARTYFIDYASEYGDKPLYAHVGGANAAGPADALGQLDQYGWSGVNDLNQFSIGFPTFYRNYNRLDHTVATEHTMESSTTKLWDFAAKDRGLTNVDKQGTSWNTKFVQYSFKDDQPTPNGTQTIHLSFWGDPDYAVDWIYDSATNTYKRNNGGQPHMDLLTHQQLAAKNVVVLLEKELNADDGYANNEHLLYGDTGTGKALVFMDGKETMATWKKASRTARTLLYDQQGNPIKFDRGQIWFTIYPADKDVVVK